MIIGEFGYKNKQSKSLRKKLMGHPNACIILFHPVVWIAWRGEIGRGEERRGANYGVKEAPKYRRQYLLPFQSNLFESVKD